MEKNMTLVPMTKKMQHQAGNLTINKNNLKEDSSNQRMSTAYSETRIIKTKKEQRLDMQQEADAYTE
jgi:hypothetical protein